MVLRLQEAGIIKSRAVLDIMSRVDRKHYVPMERDLKQARDKANTTIMAYLDRPLRIDNNQTISAPHAHAMALELILPSLEHNGASNSRPIKILDVGCGSGYLTACFGRLCDGGTISKSILPFRGKVFGIDIHPKLVQLTTSNLERQDGDLLKNGTITLQCGNGWVGLPKEAPFDAIHVGAAASQLPTELALQLGLGGVLVVPVGQSGGVQALLKVQRVNTTSASKFVWNDYHVERWGGVRYVPLIHS